MQVKCGGSGVTVAVGQVVHVKCRADFTNSKSVKCYLKRKSSSVQKEHQPHTLRSEESSFSYKDDCILCGCSDVYSCKKTEHKFIPVRTMDFQDKILKDCDEFQGNWADIVKGRLRFVPDLPAADAVYHNICSINFRTGKQIPKIFQKPTEQRAAKCRKISRNGRPKDAKKFEAFQAVAVSLENNDDEQLTINDLINKMKEYLKDTELDAYTFPYMKRPLQKHFKNRIIITEINGKQNVVSSSTTASEILYNLHHQKKQNEADEKNQIIVVQPCTLPPTSAAAKYHILRVYQQVQVWMGHGQDVPPDQWGWKVSQGKMVPILTDNPPAPEELLQMIRCKCKTGCYSMKCPCKRNGLDCSMACTECRGVCSNISLSDDDTDTEEEPSID